MLLRPANTEIKVQSRETSSVDNGFASSKSENLPQTQTFVARQNVTFLNQGSQRSQIPFTAGQPLILQDKMEKDTQSMGLDKANRNDRDVIQKVKIKDPPQSSPPDMNQIEPETPRGQQ